MAVLRMGKISRMKKIRTRMKIGIKIRRVRWLARLVVESR